MFVISPTGQTVYSVIDGQMSEVDADTWLAGDLRALLKKASAAENHEEVVVEMLHHEDAPAFVAASAITVGTDSSVPEIPGPPSLMLFVKVALIPEPWKTWRGTSPCPMPISPGHRAQPIRPSCSSTS